MPSARRAVFLDRDGVINQMVYNPEFGIVDSPANPDEFQLIAGVGEVIAGFNRLGYLVMLASNQPGIAKGKFSPTLLERMTGKMLSGIQAAGGRIDAVYYCLHHPQAILPEYRTECDCRKPKCGLLLKAAKEWDIDLGISYMIGDGITDVLAGRTAGTKTIFVNSRKCYLCDEFTARGVQPDFIAANLAEAFEIIRLMDDGDEQSAFKYSLAQICSTKLPGKEK